MLDQYGLTPNRAAMLDQYGLTERPTNVQYKAWVSSEVTDRDSVTALSVIRPMG